MKAGSLEFRHHVKTTEYPTSATITQVTATTTDTIVLTHPVVSIDSAAGVCTLAVPDGEEGQTLTIISTDAADVDVTPATSTMFTAIALDAIGDWCTIYYVDDTVGWAILSMASVAIDSSPAYSVA